MNYIKRHTEIEQNGTLYPIEIKKSANPNKSMIENFEVLKNVNDKKIGDGVLFVCMIMWFI